VDKFADQVLAACKERQSEAPIPFSTARAWIKTGLTRQWRDGINMQRFRAAAVAGKKPTIRAQYAELAREDAVVLAQLRTGQCRMMGPFRAKVQRLDPTCRWCRDAVETVDHLFNECAGEGIKELKESLKVKDATILYRDPEQALLFFAEADLLTYKRE
jgi:hypothetical protein